MKVPADSTPARAFMMRLLQASLAVSLLAATFAAGAVIERVRAQGLPTVITVTAMETKEGPCGARHYIAFADDAGQVYEGQLVSESEWSRLHVGDRLPARRNADGTLASYETRRLP